MYLSRVATHDRVVAYLKPSNIDDTQILTRAGATILQVVRLNLCHHCQTYILE